MDLTDPSRTRTVCPSRLGLFRSERQLAASARLVPRTPGRGTRVLLGWLGALALSLLDPARAETLAVAAVAADGTLPAWILNPNACRAVNRDGRASLEIEADRDPYTKVEWQISLGPVSGTLPATVTLEVEFLDWGAGLIEPKITAGGSDAKNWTFPGRRTSYTRLNTGNVRRAWFEFASGSFAAPQAPIHVRIAGLQHLLAVRLLPVQTPSAWAALRSTIPKKVKPMVTLQRPLELVTTAGVDVLGDMSTLDASLEALSDLAPLARVLGFTSIESYVTWKRLEPRREGEFDFSFYDAVVQRLAEHDLKWFPLLIIGSGYALPEWFIRSPENHGFVCLEHGLTNAIQSIWAPTHRRHVTRVLRAFGEHYEPMHALEGVRLGPSGNYGESQYPAGGNWGPSGAAMHIHIGWWAGDTFGQTDYQRWLKARYGTIQALNAAWGTRLKKFTAVRTRLPEQMLQKAERLDFTQWYTDSMTDWCGWWAEESRRALPHTPIYQSAGGWGFRETGTDYSAQTKAMQSIGGGTRLTNETDSYEQNFYATRLAATAARLYKVGLGYEPASSHTARGVAGRIFGSATSNADHLFSYHNNVFDHGMEIDRWLKYLPILDARQEPVIDVAVYYPETENQVGDAAFRHLYAWGFNPVAREIRRVVEVDYLDDRLIREGFLARYKVLVFAWGNQIPADVQRTVDAWLRAGGTVIYPSYPRGPQEAIDPGVPDPAKTKAATPSAVFQGWATGDTGRGAFHRFPGDAEPPELYGDYVKQILRKMTHLHPWTQTMLSAHHPSRVFLSVQQDGHALVLNYRDEPAPVTVSGHECVIEPYGIARIPLPPLPAAP
jgi:hypothetical protein